MVDVAAREGLAPTMGQSPFALQRGQRFERQLFREDAAVLRSELENAGVGDTVDAKKLPQPNRPRPVIQGRRYKLERI